jgi:hypothetical protein
MDSSKYLITPHVHVPLFFNLLQASYLKYLQIKVTKNYKILTKYL